MNGKVEQIEAGQRRYADSDRKSDKNRQGKRNHHHAGAKQEHERSISFLLHLLGGSGVGADEDAQRAADGRAMPAALSVTEGAQSRSSFVLR
jgi:hypothetical protein